MKYFYAGISWLVFLMLLMILYIVTIHAFVPESLHVAESVWCFFIGVGYQLTVGAKILRKFKIFPWYR